MSGQKLANLRQFDRPDLPASEGIGHDPRVTEGGFGVPDKMKLFPRKPPSVGRTPDPQEKSKMRTMGTDLRASFP